MHSQFEQYTQEIETRLNALPYAYRQSEMEEIRQHIQAMVESRVELGSEETEAVAATLEQFGPAKTISRGLVRAYKRRHPSLRRSLAQSTACALTLLFGGEWLLSLLLKQLTSATYKVDVQFFDPQGLWLVNLIVFPLLMGALTAQITPRRAREGAALSFGLVFALLLALTVPFVMQAHLPLLTFWQHLLPNIAALIVCAAVSALGAHAGGQWRKTRLRRRAAD